MGASLEKYIQVLGAHSSNLRLNTYVGPAPFRPGSQAERDYEKSGLPTGSKVRKVHNASETGSCTSAGEENSIGGKGTQHINVK